MTFFLGKYQRFIDEKTPDSEMMEINKINKKSRFKRIALLSKNMIERIAIIVQVC